MAVIKKWTVTELEDLASIAVTRDKGILQNTYDQNIAKALQDFAHVIAKIEKKGSYP